MKLIIVIILVIGLFVNLQAGKIIWADNGSATIGGTSGQGCIQSGFGTEDKNATKANCS